MNDKIRIAIGSLGLNPEHTMRVAEITKLSETEILEGLAKVYRLKISGFNPRHAHTITRLACMYQSGISGPPNALRATLSILSSYLANRGEKW